MQANEFVKKFGWPLVQRDVAALEQGFITKADFLENYGFEILDELAQLVKSWELVQSYGSLEDAKKALSKKSMLRWIDPETELLRQAIADVEGCQ